MLVDHEKAWQKLKSRLSAQHPQGIGTEKLFVLMSELEVECELEEGVPEAALRLYGNQFSADMNQRGVQPAPEETHASAGDGLEPALPRTGDGAKEAHDGHGHRDAAAVAG